MLKEEEKEAVVDVKLEEEKDQPKVLDACPQTPKRRRSSGRASRMRLRRLLADEEERAAPITSAAHPRGGRCQALQTGGVEKNTGGVSFADAEEEWSLQDEGR